MIGRPRFNDEQIRASFLSRVCEGTPDECWPWLGHRRPNGYGVFWCRNVPTVAHRFAWALASGRPPEPGEIIMHTCDNPPCCNPAHLRLGDVLANNRDTVAKGRHAEQKKTHCKRGHEFTPENTYTRYKDGRQWPGRVCRTCALKNSNGWNERQRQIKRIPKLEPVKTKVRKLDPAIWGDGVVMGEGE